MKTPVEKVTMTEYLTKAWGAAFNDDPAVLGTIPLEFLDRAARKMPHQTILLFAVLNKKWLVVDELVRLGCNPLSQNDYGQSPLGELLQERSKDALVDVIWEQIVQGNRMHELPPDVLTSAMMAGRLDWINRAMSSNFWTVEKVRKEKRPKKLSDSEEISKSEWDIYREDALNPPILLKYDLGLSWFSKEKQKEWVAGSVPLEYAMIGVKDASVLEWANANNIETDISNIPFKWQNIYTLLALERGHEEKLDILLKEEPDTTIMADKKLLAYSCMCKAISGGRLSVLDAILKTSKEKWDTDMLSVRHQYTEEKSANSPAYFKPQRRDYHPIFKMIFHISRTEEYLAEEASLMTDDVAKREREKLNGLFNTFKALLDRGLSPDFRERGWGFSLIHSAATCGCVSVTNELIARGASLSVKTGKKENGKTPRTIAFDKNKTAVLSILEAAELKVSSGLSANTKNTNKASAL